AVASGTQLWARWTGPSAPVNGFRITAQASLTQGTVYLYDTESSDRPAAQKLVHRPRHDHVPEDGSIVGPFTVSGTTSGALDAAVGVEVFLDQAGTQPVPVGTAVASGTQLWARWTGPSAPVNGFRITAQASLTQ
ncbi:hypothetical protein CTI14_43700, partial [Methylobacterium radiotolerans]